MKLFIKLKKPLCVLLASLFIFSIGSVSVSGSDTLTQEQEKAALEQRIKETENKLTDLKAKSENTQEYLDTLNKKIDYLQQQFNLVTAEVDKDKKQIETLKTKYSENQKAISSAKEDIVRLTEECSAATAHFDESYEKYAQRLRAIYISGETNSLVFLLTSNDISQLLTRYEMVKRISEQDGSLLSAIDSEIKEIKSSQQEIAAKQQELEENQTELAETQKTLEAAVPQLEEKQKNLDEKRKELSAEISQANKLLKTLNDQTGNYTEYLENDMEAMAEIDEAILAAASQYETTTTTTTTTQPAERPTGSDTSKTTTQKNPQGNYISLTYPVPSQTTVTCPFHGYSGHSGADFSCPTGSKVVAAESGTVIISADLTNADGTYRSYGRYIVIMHDKKTPSGAAVYTLYAHNSKRLVSVGQKVTKGQQIAESGSTGNSTGPHCHFEVRTPSASYSDCKNPENYLP